MSSEHLTNDQIKIQQSDNHIEKNRIAEDVLAERRLYEIWHFSTRFFNNVMHALKGFPEGLDDELLQKIEKEALAVSDSISRAFYAKAVKEMEGYLNDAVDASISTACSFNFFRQFSYMDAEKYAEIFEQSEVLQDRIHRFLDV